MHADPRPPGETGRELTGADAYAAMEAGLRRLMPAFHEHRRLTDLQVVRLPRGYAIECTFKGATPVRVVLSRSWAMALASRIREAGL